MSAESVAELDLNAVIMRAVRKLIASGKQLSEAVTTAVAINTDDLGLIGYNQVILALVRQKLDAAIETVGRQKMAEDLDKLLGTDAPKEIKLSVLVEQFKEWASKDRHNGDAERCTIIVDNDGGKYSSTWIYLDPRKATDKYECAFDMLVSNDGSMFCCKMRGKDPKKDLILGGLTGIEKTLFQLYAAGTRIVIDGTDFDTTLRREGDI